MKRSDQLIQDYLKGWVKYWDTQLAQVTYMRPECSAAYERLPNGNNRYIEMEK